jgi:hypothetical protein
VSRLVIENENNGTKKWPCYGVLFVFDEFIIAIKWPLDFHFC